MALFQTGDFTLHSGEKASWKIDCDALTRKDWDTLARIVAGQIDFYDVYGVPTGGSAFAEALFPYASETAKNMLIVDDVLTTGNSMYEARSKFGEHSIGVVVFARGVPPSWVYPIFRMPDHWLNDPLPRR